MKNYKRLSLLILATPISIGLHAQGINATVQVNQGQGNKLPPARTIGIKKAEETADSASRPGDADGALIGGGSDLVFGYADASKNTSSIALDGKQDFGSGIISATVLTEEEQIAADKNKETTQKVPVKKSPKK